jgi:hypothetical protein
MTHPIMRTLQSTEIGQQDPQTLVEVLEELVKELDACRMYENQEPIEERLDRVEAVALVTATTVLMALNK